MSGRAEAVAELRETMADLLKNSCDILTLGQYVQPSQFHMPVERFVPPGEFGSLRAEVLERGSKGRAAAPPTEVPSKSAPSMMRLSNPSENIQLRGE
jgi:lipoic acid synthetase